MIGGPSWPGSATPWPERHRSAAARAPPARARTPEAPCPTQPMSRCPRRRSCRAVACACWAPRSRCLNRCGRRPRRTWASTSSSTCGISCPASATRRWSRKSTMSTNSVSTISISCGSGGRCSRSTPPASGNGTISPAWRGWAPAAAIPSAASAMRPSRSCISSPADSWGRGPRAISACCRRSTTWTVSAMIPRFSAMAPMCGPAGRGCWIAAHGGASRWWTSLPSGFSTRRWRPRPPERSSSPTSAT